MSCQFTDTISFTYSHDKLTELTENKTRLEVKIEEITRYFGLL